MELKRTDQKTRSDRLWDVAKIGVGILIGLGMAFMTPIAKTWVDYLQALPPP